MVERDLVVVSQVVVVAVEALSQSTIQDGVFNRTVNYQSQECSAVS